MIVFLTLPFHPTAHWALFFWGGSPVDSTPDMFLPGTQAMQIDLNGDGLPDLVTTRFTGPIYEMTAGVNYFYIAFPESLPSEPTDSIYSSDSTNYIGSLLDVAFVNQDAKGDLLSYILLNSSSFDMVRYYENALYDSTIDWEYSPQNYSHWIADGGFIDFDGDSNLDIFLGLRPIIDPDSNGLVLIFLGPTFSDSPNFIIHAPAEISWHRMEFAVTTSKIGDINGDGWDDLGVTFADTNLIYFCGPVGDTLYDIRLVSRGNQMASISDINNDGFSDMGTYGFAFSGKVDVYLGGHGFDGYVDDEVREFDLPVWEQMDRIGYVIASAGDFNGDGTDDFMFATQNYCCGPLADPGEVFVVKGSANIKTGLSAEATSQLPSSIVLHQNYPNPFNPSTNIQIELSVKEPIDIEVVDMLGHKVATVYSGVLPAGVHKFEWNGRNASQVLCASGVYVVWLSTSQASYAKKMILLK